VIGQTRIDRILVDERIGDGLLMFRIEAVVDLASSSIKLPANTSSRKHAAALPHQQQQQQLLRHETVSMYA